MKCNEMGEGEGHGVAERMIQVFGNRSQRSFLSSVISVKIDLAKVTKLGKIKLTMWVREDNDLGELLGIAKTIETIKRSVKCVGEFMKNALVRSNEANELGDLFRF